MPIATLARQKESSPLQLNHFDEKEDSSLKMHGVNVADDKNNESDLLPLGHHDKVNQSVLTANATRHNPVDIYDGAAK